jgi:hypothetical protein
MVFPAGLVQVSTIETRQRRYCYREHDSVAEIERARTYVKQLYASLDYP